MCAAHHAAAAIVRGSSDDLPEEPGVYRFYGLNEAGEDTLIYVGKANHLRDRVLDHFRTGVGAGKSRDLAARVRRVEWTETAGELGALLLEAREIREFHPAYNRQVRGAGGRFTWLFAAGAAPPRLVELDAQVLGSGDAFGTWRCAADARRALESLAREHRWCLKLLGLEQARARASDSRSDAVTAPVWVARMPPCTWHASNSG